LHTIIIIFYLWLGREKGGGEVAVEEESQVEVGKVEGGGKSVRLKWRKDNDTTI
jgi:hypothetical protein